jgi:hypothetical protein
MCSTPTSCTEEYRVLASLYMLATQLQDIEAKNAAVVALISRCAHTATSTSAGTKYLPDPSTIEFFYNMFRDPAEHCAIRQALVDCFAYYGHPSLIKLYDENRTIRFPYHFLKDLTESLMDHRTKPTHGLPHEILET